MTRSTLPALTQEIACSLLRPPNTTATRGLRGCSGWGGDADTLATLPGAILLFVPSQADRPLAPATIAVVAGRPERVPDAPFSEPVTFASTYHAGGPMEYGRYGNPTWTAFEEAIGALEGGQARAFSSGLAAISAVLALLPEGAVVVAPDNAYTGTRSQLDERVAAGRATLRAVPVADTAAVVAASAGASLVWLESPTNPNLDVADIAGAAAAARAAGACSSSTARSPHPSCSGRSTRAPTSWCTAPPSSSPATPTSSWGWS